MITELCATCHGIGGYTSQINPARIIDRCGTCGGTGEIEVPDERILAPDCRDGNDRKCDGKAWDDYRDCLSVCECPCHYDLKEAS